MKFQQGGNFGSLFTTYTPVQTSTPKQESSQKSSSSSKDDSDKGKLTEKDFFTMLKDLDGLPSDMQVLAQELINTFRMTSLTGGDGINNLTTKYISSLLKLKTAKFNRNEYDETYKESVKNNSLTDLAITTSGHLMVFDEKRKIKYLTPEEWFKAKNTGKYKPLTNSNVLWLRANSPAYANDNSILEVAQNGIGLDKVAKMVKDSLETLGNTKSTSELFYTKQGQNIVKGAEELLALINGGPDAVYKIKTTNSNQKKQIEAALNYIYQALPNNAKNRLKFESNNANIMKGVSDMLMNLLTGVEKEEISMTAQIDSSATKIAGLTGESGEKTKFKQWTQLQKGEGGIDRPITIMEGEVSHGATVTGKYYSALPGVKNGPTSLQNLLTQTGLQHLGQANEGITFGGATLKQEDLAHVMYDNSGGYVATLPAIERDGVKIINIDFLKEYSDIVKNLKDKGIKEGTQNFNIELAKVLKSRGYNNLVDANGLPNRKYFGNFLIIQGYSTEQVKSIEDYIQQSKRENRIKTIEKVKDNPQLEESLISILGYKDLDKPYWFTGDYDIYRAAVYIPISNNPNDAAAADNVALTLAQSHNNEAMVQQDARDWQESYQKQQALQSTQTPDDL